MLKQTKTQKQIDAESNEPTALDRAREIYEEIIALEREEARLEALIRVYGGDRRKVQPWRRS